MKHTLRGDMSKFLDDYRNNELSDDKGNTGVSPDRAIWNLLTTHKRQKQFHRILRVLHPGISEKIGDILCFGENEITVGKPK